ncbi:MAG: cbb3-type cytochrome c oxidase subunit II [Thermoanaerobaculia bacterium]
MSRPSGRRPSARVVLAISATYVAFLLTAQYGFLDQVKAATGGDPLAARPVLLWMVIAGLLASTAAAVTGRRLAAPHAVRAGLFATAIVTGLSPLAGSSSALRIAAGTLGAALGWLTVSLAGRLPELAPRGSVGKIAGWGTGIAYLISNLPPLFMASPGGRAAAGALLCGLAACFGPVEVAEGESLPRRSGKPPRAAAVLLALLALVLVDSAFFAALQASPERLALTWGAPGLSLRQGAVHLVAAVAAGVALDAGMLSGLLVLVALLFGLGMPAICASGDSPAVGALGAIAYAAGIAAYSAALVAAPTLVAEKRSRRLGWAALMYGVAGWIGSTAGVGAALDGSSRHAARAGLACFLLAGAIAMGDRAALRRGWRPVAAALLLTLVVLGIDASRRIAEAAPFAVPAAEVLAGREVYLAEGCQYCHSQYVRTGTHDEEWWGPPRPFDRRERPPTPGNRRIGPDLSNVGLRRGATWNELHLRDPRAVSPGSRMPSYGFLFDDGRGPALVAYLASLGESARREREMEIAALVAQSPAVARGSIERGAALFARHCAPCHGSSGRGDGAAAVRFARPTMDLTRGGLPLLGPVGNAAERRSAIAGAIRFGLPPGLMPGHEWLSRSEVADLVAFVESIGGEKGPA